MRSSAWLQANSVNVGGTVRLAFEELRLDADGYVGSISSCPPIERGDGCVVTGTFSHLNRDVLELIFVGSDLVLQPTALHPLWSADHYDWVRAGQLEPGDKLLTEEGPLEVASVRWLDGIHQVYNLEVAGDHTYLVGDVGLLSHNIDGCGPDKYPDDWVNHNRPRDEVNESQNFLSEGDARAHARKHIRKDPLQLDENKYRSRDGRWQYRARPGDVAGDARGPHVHLEHIDPETGEVLRNVHLRWPRGTGR
jgi:hypothetical protein